MRQNPQPGVVVAGYRLLRPIAEGAHSSVFVAQGQLGGASVALKLVPLATGGGAGEARAIFEAAAAVALRLQHPGIVAVYAAGVEDGLAWLAMELIPGGNLGDHVPASRRLPAAQVLLAAERVARALAHIHRQGVVHRDLKPANVLVDWDSDTVKLADFGLARTGDAQQTGTGLVLGSPAYMAPEQLAGGLPTPQGDFYALGVLLFQLLCGRLPFEENSMGELLRQVACEPAPGLQPLRPDLPIELAALVNRLLSKRADQRSTDGDLLADELGRIRQALAASG